MAANYDLIENPNPDPENNTTPSLHPRIVSRGTISTDKLIKEVSYSCSLTDGDMQAALSSLAHYVAKYLKEGYNVELGEIGYFSATLKARKVTNKSEIRSASVEFDNINFRAKKEFRQRLLGGKLVRAKEGFKKSSSTSEEKRLTLLESFLETNKVITRSEYSNLTGRLKGMALKDLNKWVEKGILIARGGRQNRIYLKKEESLENNTESFSEEKEIIK